MSEGFDRKHRDPELDAFAEISVFGKVGVAVKITVSRKNLKVSATV